LRGHVVDHRSTAKTVRHGGRITAIQEDTPVRDNRVGNELKEVAQDVLRLGVQCVQAGRTWLNDRRTDMAQRSNEHGNDQDRDRSRGQSYGHYDQDRSHGQQSSGQSGPSQFAGDYQSQGMEQNRRNDRDDDRMWGGQGRGGSASYGGSQAQDRQQFAGGAEQAYFGRGGREAGQNQGYGQGQGYGSEGAQGYGNYGGSQTYGGSSNSYGGGSQGYGQGQQGFGTHGQVRGQSGYGQDRGYGSQGYGSDREFGQQGFGSQGDGDNRGQERGYGSGQQNRGSNGGHGYGQGQHGYGQDDRSQQLQGRYGQQGRPFGQGADHYARSGLGNETIGQGRIGGYGAVGGGGGFGTDAFGGPQQGQGFGGSSGYGAGGQSYGQQYGYRDDNETGHQSGSQFGGQQQSHRGRGPKNYARSDERIVEDINDRLTHADDIDASDIDVRCESGKITLEGTVEHRWMKHRAEDIADSCAGVKDVENRITVKSSRDRGSSSELGGQQSTLQGQARNGGGKESKESTPSSGGRSGTSGGSGATGGSQQH
jgi:hypothetical protein